MPYRGNPVVGSNPTLSAHCSLSRHRNHAEPTLGVRFALVRTGPEARGLVGTGEVEGEGSEDLAGGGVDDANIEVLDEQDDGGSGMGSTDADVEQAAGDPQGDLAGGVDHVMSDSAMVVECAAGHGRRFGPGVVHGGGGSPVGERAVWSLLVVELDEGVEHRLQADEGVRLLRLSAQPLLHRLLEALDFAAGGGVVGAGVLLLDVEASQLGLQAVATALAARESGGEDHAVVG